MREEERKDRKEAKSSEVEMRSDVYASSNPHYFGFRGPNLASLTLKVKPNVLPSHTKVERKKEKKKNYK